MLDTLWGHFYKARALWAAGALLLAPVAWAEMVGGVALPDGSRKVGEDRYRSSRDFEDTLDFYKKTYPSDRFPRKFLVNQPGVKAIHIVNPSGKNFEGLNIYEANDEVRIFVVRPSKSKK